MPTPTRRRFALAAVAVVAVLALAIPVFGADPSPTPGTTKETHDKPDKASKAPEVSLTLTGVVTKAADAKGRPTYSMTAAGTTWELSVGPKWYWLDKNPLEPFVGKSVTVVGTHHAGDTELDVETVDGKAVRAAGRPPWAGGPKVVGERHPGWKSWKAAGKHGNGHGNGKGHDASDPAEVEQTPD